MVFTTESHCSEYGSVEICKVVAGVGLEFTHVNFKYLTEKAITDLRS